MHRADKFHLGTDLFRPTRVFILLMPCGTVGAKVWQSGNPDAPGVWDEAGRRQKSGRSGDSPNAHIFFADVTQVL